MLDERKLKVLYAIINSYIISAEPIGSRTLSKHYDLGVSSATIRNEMSDLEELGLLNKPHSSAGRIPSDKAYRLYVDSLLKLNKFILDENKKQQIKNILISETQELEHLLQTSAKVLSEITNYTALAVSPHLKNSKIKHIQLISIDNNQVLLVIVNNSDIVKSTIFELDKPIPVNQLNTISNFLNNRLKGLSFIQLNSILDLGILNELYEFKDILENLIPVINKSMDDTEYIELYSEGITRLLNYPEYNNVDKAKSILSFIEDKDLVLGMLLDDTLCNDIDIIIGTENNYAQLKDSSIVTATYSIGGKTIGKIGVIGPTRMDYYKLINTLRLFSTNISEILEKLSGK
ncbi:heat-inducible transcriptional repressor HrcA [Tissierella sp. Yu-01]|uniref:heat-inducible transcriptional repressor HrcA n=1 Tax=Tissierella sp. Yu-01 TaxID=3035694 RepID=UPI00240D8A5B|nr:heat-inducible transcriptional repressor HrcA [Tissierella sp. Yu-01]WFA09536.1 heat-inducible transcriptional repressor HrcA [Tissierella sp. Yu-01]